MMYVQIRTVYGQNVAQVYGLIHDFQKCFGTICLTDYHSRELNWHWRMAGASILVVDFIIVLVQVVEAFVHMLTLAWQSRLELSIHQFFVFFYVHVTGTQKLVQEAQMLDWKYMKTS